MNVTEVKGDNTALEHFASSSLCLLGVKVSV